ncbi:hypothetical protein [Pseudonocardia sp. TRM90224]|uniref:hypothetical protein n=1 Tax=Pseudonocardia sp. TRM90224 TaxID=2812678 RepID=UPI001E485AD6|nr:hypothetical protein [Pseudonocardia sp. TRM90224]
MRSRSGSAASRRNGLPVAFPLPGTIAPLVHEVWMREWEDDFAPTFSTRFERPKKDTVLLRDDGDVVRVMLVPDQTPGVITRRPPGVRLHAGERLRWQITYRHKALFGPSQWWYRLDTLNLAVGSVGDVDAFLAPPTSFVDERHQLVRYDRV